jgi:hypothetical protein
MISSQPEEELLEIRSPQAERVMIDLPTLSLV